MKNPITSALSRRHSAPGQSLWRAMSELENEMDRWFGGGMSADLSEGRDFSPSTEFNESEKEYVLKVDIPGMKKEDVKIEIEDGCLTVSGERREEKEEKDTKHHYRETSYGSFMRSFTLPHAIKEDQVKAEYENGVLKLTVPKAENGKAAKKIAVK